MTLHSVKGPSVLTQARLPTYTFDLTNSVFLNCSYNFLPFLPILQGPFQIPLLMKFPNIHTCVCVYILDTNICQILKLSIIHEVKHIWALLMLLNFLHINIKMVNISKVPLACQDRRTVLHFTHPQSIRWHNEHSRHLATIWWMN